MTPIDIITQAIRKADDSGESQTPFGLARRVAEGLTDDRIVAAAVQALRADGWEETPEGPMGLYQMSDDDLRNIALAVLRSVRGA